MPAQRRPSAAAARRPPFSLLARTLFASALAAPAVADPRFATPPPVVPAGGVTWIVTNCDDDGLGSLRQIVRDLATSGDTVDLTFLVCSTITLSTGAIAVDLDDLAVVGAGRDRITIDGAHLGRVVTHSGSGTLDLRGLDVANGKYAANAVVRGGCIYSSGKVALNGVSVHDCLASGSGARGGGVYARGDLGLTDSTVANCTALASGETVDVAQGGGVFANADLVVIHSTISGNWASSDNGTGAMFGGGAYTRGNLAAKYSGFFDNATHADVGYDSAGGVGVAGGASVIGSSIHANSAMSSGGLAIRGGNGVEVTISNSTISANQSRRGAGLTVGAPFTLSNSTVTGNRTYFFGPTNHGGAGVFVGTTATIESSIIAGNLTTNGAPAADLGGDGTATITGSHNLVGMSRLAVPPDTSNADPGLAAPIRRGPATLYPLLPGSAAIDAGSNPRFLPFDQRGDPFRRVVGGEADIGAYEFDPDRIFFDDFD